MQTAYYKDHSGLVGKPTPQSSAVPCMSWWSGIGSQMIHGGSCNTFKSLYVDHPDGIAGSLKQSGLQSQQLQQSSSQVSGQSPSDSEGLTAGATRMQILSTQSGYDGSNGNEQQHQQHSTTTALHSAPAEYLVPHTQLELGHSIARTTYPCADPYFGGIVAAYGAQTMIHPHILGVQQARMPLPLDVTEDEPVYVNAKQYHGILRRRQCRAKAELENKVIKVRKPYLHESRHRHAMRRARGCGGRFLNTKKLEESKVNANSGKALEGQLSQAVSSSGSEALQSENGNISSVQEVQGNSGLSGSEVTSISQSCPDGSSYCYPHSNGTYLNHHHSPHFSLSAFHPLSNGNDEVISGQGGGYAIKWITTENCCDPMKV